ncbi:MAG: ADP-ribose-binding protein, partial [Gemmatimonadetes bacterium]|nr:ADP-ribose-binding protein [Gemmatimonadota bacterium]
MLERRSDLFAQDADAVCITTNGADDRAGCAVMGRGCALQAAQR